MGNPLSSVIADIVTDRLLDVTLKQLPFSPTLLVKYVDDIFAIVPINSIDTTLKCLNKFHHKLQFTVELEEDGRIPYLDVMVIRNETGQLNTNWYKKNISSNRILNYYSCHPHSQLLNTARNFISRVLSLSSTEYITQNTHNIKETLKFNNYPIHIINSLLHTELHRITTTTQTTELHTHINSSSHTDTENINTNTNLLTYRSMIYVRGLSERIEKVLYTHLTNTRLAYRSSNCAGKIYSKLKDPIPIFKKTNVIYKIPCLGDIDANITCDFSYVGQTKQYLETRLKNHRYDLKKMLQPSMHRTALMEHFHTQNHYPNFAATQIIDTQRKYNKRLTLEAIHIYTNNTINVKRDTDNIAAVYCALLDNHTTKKRKRDDTNTHLTPTHTHFTPTHNDILQPPPKKRRC